VSSYSCAAVAAVAAVGAPLLGREIYDEVVVVIVSARDQHDEMILLLMIKMSASSMLVHESLEL
jgi:hypothetical protein